MIKLFELKAAESVDMTHLIEWAEVEPEVDTAGLKEDNENHRLYKVSDKAALDLQFRDRSLDSK